MSIPFASCSSSLGAPLSCWSMKFLTALPALPDFARRCGAGLTGLGQYLRSSLWSLFLKPILMQFTRDLVRPAIAKDDYIIAPTEEQRMRYAWRLHVWGKKQATMSPRMKALLLAYNVRLSIF